MDEADRAGWLAQCLGNSAHSPLGEEDLEALLAAATVETAPAGTVIISRDDSHGQVFILEHGKVALTRPNSERTPMLLMLHPGDIFGDLEVLLGRPAPAEAVVLEDAQFLNIAGDRLLWLVSTKPRIALRWMVSIAGRLNAAQDRLEQLLAGPLDFQIASLLRHVKDEDNVARVSQETIAQLLGTRRPSVARSLSNLEKQGLIEKRYREIHIVDEQRLAALTA